jgi:hypothetical protein
LANIRVALQNPVEPWPAGFELVWNELVGPWVIDDDLPKFTLFSRGSNPPFVQEPGQVG